MKTTGEVHSRLAQVMTGPTILDIETHETPPSSSCCYLRFLHVVSFVVRNKCIIQTQKFLSIISLLVSPSKQYNLQFSLFMLVHMTVTTFCWEDVRSWRMFTVYCIRHRAASHRTMHAVQYLYGAVEIRYVDLTRSINRSHDVVRGRPATLAQKSRLVWLERRIPRFSRTMPEPAIRTRQASCGFIQ